MTTEDHFNRIVEEVHNEHREAITPAITAELDALGIGDRDEYREELHTRIGSELQARRREILDEARDRLRDDNEAA